MSTKGKQSIENLKLSLTSLEQDYEKFEKGNKSAGTRARNTLQSIKVICQELRVEIQESKNNQ